MGGRAKTHSTVTVGVVSALLLVSSCSSGVALDKSGVANKTMFCKGAHGIQAAASDSDTTKADSDKIKALTTMQQASNGSLRHALDTALADFYATSKQTTSAYGSAVRLIMSSAQSVCGINPNATPAKSVAPAQSVGTPPSTAPTDSLSTSSATASGGTVTFDGVTVAGATDLSRPPMVTAKGAADPTKLQYKDLVVGSGAAATPASTVTVQYVGVFYDGGVTPFDSSWSKGNPAQFSLSQVVPGFATGIGGGSGVPAMKVGGRRLIVVPSALGYGSHPQGSIPANSPLVFVVDLVSVGS